MSEYWKSNPRKFCEYCKCWFADNKVSTEFHERGKRHQEAVQAKISELQKKGVQDAKDKEQMEKDLDKMEKAAMKALKEDLKRDPSLAKAYGLELKESGCALPPSDYTPSQEKQSEEPEIPEPISEESSEPKFTKGGRRIYKRKDKGTWKVLNSPEGFPYYWNQKTNAVQWTKPDGYVERETESEDSSTNVKTEDSVTSNTDNTEPPAVVPCERIPLPSDVPSQIPASPCREERRATKRSNVYGAWSTVQDEVQEAPIDLQLPPPAALKVKTQTSTYTERPKLVFKEKTMTSSILPPGKKTGIVFKRRKVNSGNMRAKDDVDEETEDF